MGCFIGNANRHVNRKVISCLLKKPPQNPERPFRFQRGGLFAIDGGGVFADEAQNVFNLPIYMVDFCDPAVFSSRINTAVAHGDHHQVGLTGGCSYLS